MYNTIIVPTDMAHEDLTISSLKRAEKLSNNGRIILLHALETIPSYALVEVPLDLIPNLVPKAEETLNEWVNKSGVKAEIEVRHGGAYRQILGSAKENNADIILIDSHKPGFQDYLLGSTASKVVRHATCSVLVER